MQVTDRGAVSAPTTALEAATPEVPASRTPEAAAAEAKTADNKRSRNVQLR